MKKQEVRKQPLNVNTPEFEALLVSLKAAGNAAVVEPTAHGHAIRVIKCPEWEVPT
jgi:hypothetical protein